MSQQLAQYLLSHQFAQHHDIPLVQLSLKSTTNLITQLHYKPHSPPMDNKLKEIKLWDNRRINRKSPQESDYSETSFHGELNFLDDIKGHLDSNNSFDTDIHDVYNPEFSIELLEPEDDVKKRAEKSTRCNSLDKRTMKIKQLSFHQGSVNTKNTICSISTFCNTLQNASKITYKPDNNIITLKHALSSDKLQCIFAQIKGMNQVNRNSEHN